MGAKVCIFTSVHQRDDVRIFRKEARSLAAAGHDVTAIVADGKGDEQCPEYRLVDVGVSPAGRWGRISLTAGRILRRALALKAQIYHFHDPELLPVGLLLRMLGRRVIYDVHEDLPRQTLSKHYLHPWIRRPLAAVVEVLENLIAYRMSGIMAATPTIAARFPPRRTSVIQNYPILAELDRPAATPYRGRPAAAVYLGGLARIRGIVEMVKAIGLVHARRPATLILGGKFAPSELAAEVQALNGWSAVDFRGWLTRDGVADVVNQARVGLVTLHPTINYVDALPIKLFEYIAVGIPVIASDFPLWRSIVESSQCGLLVDPLDPNAIAQAIEWILSHEEEAEAMGERGRQAILTSTNWNIESRKLISHYERILAAG